MIFGILGIICLFGGIPKEKGMENYKKARTVLGCGLSILAVYSITRLIFPQTHEHYISFWLLATFTLIHSWLTYSTMLFLMESPMYVMKRFFIDGIVPTSLMLITGILGVFITSLQPALFIIFGCIFGVKCAWMYYTCINEYRKCNKELENFYDQRINIRWIGGLIWISLIMSAATVVAFYTPAIHFIYYLLIPVIYTYIVVKVLNFMPKKIDNIRHCNLTLNEEPKAEKIEKSKDLADKMAPKVAVWIEDKKFCTSDLTIKDVAMDMGTNHNYLSQYLNNVLGVTFQVWLNTLRVEESKTILTSGEKISIEEVGVRVGIPQAYNFSRWFKAITDMTPYQFRKANS